MHKPTRSGKIRKTPPEKTRKKGNSSKSNISTTSESETEGNQSVMGDNEDMKFALEAVTRKLELLEYSLHDIGKDKTAESALLFSAQAEITALRAELEKQ